MDHEATYDENNYTFRNEYRNKNNEFYPRFCVDY